MIPNNDEGTEAPVVGLESPNQVEQPVQEREPESHESHPEQDPERQRLEDAPEDPPREAAPPEEPPAAPGGEETPAEPAPWQPDESAITQSEVQSAREMAEFHKKRYQEASGRYGRELQQMRERVSALEGGDVPRGTYPQRAPRQTDRYPEQPPARQSAADRLAQQQLEDRELASKRAGNTHHWDTCYRDFFGKFKLTEVPEEIQSAIVEHVRANWTEIEHELRTGDAKSIKTVGAFYLNEGFANAVRSRHTRLAQAGEQARQEALARKRHATPPSAHGGRRPARSVPTDQLSPEELDRLPRAERKAAMESRFAHEGRRGF